MPRRRAGHGSESTRRAVDQHRAAVVGHAGWRSTMATTISVSPLTSLSDTVPVGAPPSVRCSVASSVVPPPAEKAHQASGTISATTAAAAATSQGQRRRRRGCRSPSRPSTRSSNPSGGCTAGTPGNSTPTVVGDLVEVAAARRAVQHVGRHRRSAPPVHLAEDEGDDVVAEVGVVGGQVVVSHRAPPAPCSAGRAAAAADRCGCASSPSRGGCRRGG